MRSLAQGTNKLVCMAFDKFWESYDDRSAASVLDWSSAVAAEKADGMLTKLYRYNDQWRIASNGMINADKATLRSAGPNVTVGSLFRDAANRSIPGGFSALLASLDPSRTYAFELLHPAHRIVCYQRSPRLIHLCTRVQSSGEEIYDDNLTLVPRPAAVSVAGGLAALQARASSLSSQGEGFVVRDGQNRRIKVKGSEYLRAHREEDRLNSNVWFHVCSAYLLPGKLSSSMSWQALLPAGFDEAGCAAFLRGALRTVCGEGVSETEGKAELVRSLARREVFEAIVYGGVEEMRGVEKVLAPATAAVPDSLAACLDTHDVVIMRGLPGAGKSTHIAMVRAERPDLVFRVSSADDYFVDPISGSYNFDRANLPDAHSHCRSVARAAVAAGQKVIIDNTNSTVKEMAPYLDLAATFRLKAVVFELDCDGPEEAALMAGRNQHGVPLSGVERMLSGWESAPQGVQVVRARRVAAGLVEVLRKLHEKSQLLYAAVFLDPASKRKLAQMRRPEHLEIQDGDHATIAFHRKFPNTPSFFAQLAGVVGKKVQMEVTHLAADHGLAAAAVSCADSGVMGVAALAGHVVEAEEGTAALHVTLAHARGEKPARSAGLLQAAAARTTRAATLSGEVKLYLADGSVRSRDELLQPTTTTTTSLEGRVRGVFGEGMEGLGLLRLPALARPESRNWGGAGAGKVPRAEEAGGREGAVRAVHGSASEPREGGGGCAAALWRGEGVLRRRLADEAAQGHQDSGLEGGGDLRDGAGGGGGGGGSVCVGRQGGEQARAPELVDRAHDRHGRV